MPKPETRPKILAAIKRVEKAVRDTKDDLVQFRIEPGDLAALYQLAEKHRRPLGTMVREWVLERMQLELATPPATKSITLLDIDQRLESIERKLQLRNKK